MAVKDAQQVSRLPCLSTYNATDKFRTSNSSFVRFCQPAATGRAPPAAVTVLKERLRLMAVRAAGRLHSAQRDVTAKVASRCLQAWPLKPSLSTRHKPYVTMLLYWRNTVPDRKDAALNTESKYFVWCARLARSKCVLGTTVPVKLVPA